MENISKNKEDKIRELTWKYFIQQKCIEIGKFLLIPLGALVFILLCDLFGFFLCSNGQADEVVCSESLTYVGFVNIIGIIAILMILVLFGYLVYITLKDWIKSNWERAKERAIKEVKLK